MTGTEQRPAAPRWPLVERWGLFEAIRAAVATSGCVVSGPAGAGKSTAARLALEPIGPAVVIAGVVGLGQIPLGALSMAEMTAPVPTPDDGTDDLVHRVRTWLAHLRVGETPVVIDDPAVLDPDSIDMLAEELGRGLRAVITHRGSQPPPAALAAVIATRGFGLLEIEPFDASMVALTIEEALGAEPTEAAVEHLTALSGGNPMLLREIVRDLAARGAWFEQGERMDLAVDANPSARLSELLAARFPSGEPAADLLGLVAHAGRLGPDLLTALDAAPLVPGLVDDGWLIEHDMVTMAHPLMTQLVTDRLHDEPTRDALLRRGLARVGPTQDLTPDSRLVCLRWALTAGVALTATELQWGRAEASRRWDRDLACLIADRLSLQQPSTDTTLELALALSHAARYDEVIAVLRAGRATATTDEDIAQIARFLLRFAGPLARLKRWGDPPDGLDRDTAAWADAALGTTAFTELLAAFECLAAGALPEARARADAVRAGGIDPVGGDADEVTMLASLYGGDDHAALAAFDRLGARLADPRYRHPKPVVIDAAASSLLMLTGRFEQAFAFDHRIREIARTQGDNERRREMTGHLGMTALFLGRIDAAIEAFGLLRDYPAPPNSLRTLYTAGLAQALGLAGRLDEAERALAEAERDHEVVSPMMEADFHNLAGLVMHLLGHTDAGEQRLRRSLDIAAAWRNSRAELMGLHGLARIGRVGDDDIRAMDARAERGSHDPAPAFAAGVALMVEGAAHDDPQAHAQAALAFASTGFALGAAEGYAAACRSRAGSSGRAGDRAGDRAAWTAALDDWLTRCPGLVGATVLVERGPDALTPREREIAALAAGGLMNPVIAERLGISGRTVENCLHRAFTKLAISSRAEIRPALLSPSDRRGGSTPP